ncbi:MAG: hypothetical protein M3R13_10320 [Armatimonadota bacterium]|nr:hypothetical protein [Armatimonadota bacterium]
MKKITLCTICAFFYTCAQAQWTYEVLWANRGAAEDIDGDIVGGAWSPVPGSREGVVLDLVSGILRPGFGAAQGTGVINAVHGGQQVGVVQQDMFAPRYAVLWSGSPAPIVYLHPAWDASIAYDVYDGVQVGEVTDYGVHTHAAMWYGTPGSWIDLHPAGHSFSSAVGIFENTQVGAVDDGAALWHGTAGSYVRLHPAGWAFSWASAVHGDQQVGATTNFPENRAALWYGTAASYVNLHPAGHEESTATDVHSGQQVGYVANSGNPSAAYWTGSAASYVDLDPFLPQFWFNSEARGIWDDGDETRIVGTASNPVGDVFAVMWVRLNDTVPVTSLDVIRGIVSGGGLASLAASDDSRLEMKPGIVFSTSQEPVLIKVTGTSPQLNPAMLSFFVESSATGGPSIRQSIQMYDFDAGVYESVDVQPCTALDETVRVTITDDPGRFIGPSGQVDAQVGYKATAPVFQFPWRVRLDRVRWIVPGT